LGHGGHIFTALRGKNYNAEKSLIINSPNNNK